MSALAYSAVLAAEVELVELLKVMLLFRLKDKDSCRSSRNQEFSLLKVWGGFR